MKRIRICTVFLIILVVLFCYIRLPDYEIYSSTSFSNGGNRDTTLNVIVYQYWGIDELAERIKAEHNMINGTPTELEIKMYYSEWHLYKSAPFKSISYE